MIAASRPLSAWAASVLVMLERNPCPETRGPKFLRLAEEARREVEVVSALEVQEALRRGVPVIDVRERPEFHRSHIPGVRSVPRGILEPVVERDYTDPTAPLILYCASGNRSGLAAENLRAMGYENVRILDGGFHAWLKTGQSVESSRPYLDD